MRPTVPRSWPRWSASSPKATRRWSATPAFGATSRRSATSTSRSIPTRSRRSGSSTASSFCAPTPISIRSRPYFATSSCGRWSRLPNSQAPVLHPTDLPQARRDHPWSRVLQLPRAGAEDGAGGPHCGAGSLRLLAGNHRRSGLADRDRDRARRQALHRPLRAAPGRQLGLACRRHRAAADRPRGRRLLTSPNRKRSATAPSRRRLLLSISYLVNRTVEDGSDIALLLTSSRGPLVSLLRLPFFTVQIR